MKKPPTLLNEETILSYSESAEYNFHKEQLKKRGSVLYTGLDKRRLGRSNVSPHETTPLFGLWQGHNSHKMSLSHENQPNYNNTNGLFLAGQNQTNITAHIGTTVIMDCKIIKPNLEKHAPVRNETC